jgi:purine-binding chemotaxis protein CheW
MPTKAANHSHFVVFTADDQTYALPLNHVSRVVRMVALTSVPESAPWIAGFINVTGTILPVVDLRRRLGGASKVIDPNDCLLIIDVPEQNFALIVDRVLEVLECPSAQLESPPDALFPNQKRLLTGVIQQGESLVLMLDPSRLL